MAGGLNNARSRLQTCVRLAIDASVGLLIGIAMTRNPANLVDTSDQEVCPDTFWNTENLEKELKKKKCLQLKQRHCSNLTGMPTILKPPHKPWTASSYVQGKFGEWVHSYLDTDTYRIDTSRMSASSPVVVEFADSFNGWNDRKSNELSTIRKELFRTLTYNAELLSIGTKILKSEELKNGYIDVHLRGESDWPAGFGSAELQMSLYPAELERLTKETQDLGF